MGRKNPKLADLKKRKWRRGEGLPAAIPKGGDPGTQESPQR